MSRRCSRCFEPFDSDDGSVFCPDCRAEDAAEKPSVPRVFGRYEILSEINRGAMGIVYRARETSLGRTVALKVLLAGEHASDQQVGRFIREAKAIARLRHPNIVPIHDVGEVDGRHYFTMDYIEGKPLSRLTAEGKIEPRQALDLVEDIADAVACAHQAGVVHRDIKPSNIMIDEQGRPLIMDFGLAKPVEGGTKYTRAGTTIGTPAYMPPEQARGELEKVGPQSDVYAMGAVLYELLTGAPPFDGDNMLDVILDVIHEDPVPPRKKNPKINPDIQTIILHALEKDPARRYQSAGELRDDIRRYKDGQAIRARAPSVTRHLRRWCSRHKFEVAMTAVVGIVLVGVWFLVRDLRRRMEESALEARLVGEQLEKMKEGDKPVWNTIWQDDSPSAGEGGRWLERKSFLSGAELVPKLGEPFPALGSLKLTASVSIDEKAPEGVTVSCGLFSDQDKRGPVPFYGTVGAGKVQVHAVPNIEQSGVAGTTKKDFAVLIERDVPRLRRGGKYLVMFERRGIDVRFQVVGDDIDEVLEVRNVHFSNWRAKNLYPVVGLAAGVRWSAFRLDKLTAGKKDTFETADGLFFIGEYNGAQSDYATIVASPRAPHRVNRARLRLGMCAEIKREFERALEWYSGVEGGEEEAEYVVPTFVDARLREPFCHLVLEDVEAAARAFHVLAERTFAGRARALRSTQDESVVSPPLVSPANGAPGEGDFVWDIGGGPYAWKLAGLAEGFMKAKMETVAAEVIRIARPARGWTRMERNALAVGQALAKSGKSAEFLALAEACRGADLSRAFADITKLLAGRGSGDEALRVLAQARRRYPDEGKLFSAGARDVARRLVEEERFTDVIEVHRIWPVKSVAGVFKDAVKGAAEKKRFDDALAVLAFAHSANPGHTKGLRRAAVDLARRLRDEARFADVRRVFESYPDSVLAPEVRLAIEGVTSAGDLDEAMLLLDFARQNLGTGDRALEEAAARVSGVLAESSSVEDALRVRESVAAYPAGTQVPHVRKAMAVLAEAGRALDGTRLFATMRARLPEGDSGLADDVLGLIEGMPDRADRADAFDVLASVTPSFEQTREARARWLVEFGDIVLQTESRPERAEELYGEAARSDGGTGRGRAAAVGAARLALLMEALGRRDEATRLWESLVERSGTPEGLREATKVLLARVPPEALAQWQAAHPAELSGAEMSLYLGIRALRLKLRDEAVEAFRRSRRAVERLERGRRWPYHILGRLGT